MSTPERQASQTLTQSHQVVQQAAGASQVYTSATGLSGMAVTHGNTYETSCYCLADAGATPRQFNLTIWFYDVAGTKLAPNILGVNTGAGTFTQAQFA